jgi:hypothetical protein
MSFITEMQIVENELMNHGHEVFIPDTTEEKYQSLIAEQIQEVKHGYIWKHIGKIEQADAVLILNYDNKGFTGYIGGNTFLEMAVALYKKMPIFILNNIDNRQNIYEEVMGMKPFFLQGRLENIS